MLKKFLSLLLACLMVLSLAACGEKTDGSRTPSRVPQASGSQPVEDDESGASSSDGSGGLDSLFGDTSETPSTPEVTAESLLASGWGKGVGLPKSASCAYEFKFTDEDNKYKAYYLDAQYDGTLGHVEGDCVSVMGVETDMDYELYHSYADDIIIRWSEGVSSANNVADDFTCSLVKVMHVSLESLIKEPKLDENDNEYRVSGKCSAKVFNDLLEFVVTDAPKIEGDVEIAALYDKSTMELAGIGWRAGTQGLTLTISMLVRDINNTSITIDKSKFDLDISVDASSGKVTIGPPTGGSSDTSTGDDNSSFSGSGETATDMLLVQAVFGMDYIQEEELEEVIRPKFSWPDEDVMFELRYFLNCVSVDQFGEMLTNPTWVWEDEQLAGIILCKIMGIPKESLYDNEFTTKELVDEYWDK